MAFAVTKKLGLSFPVGPGRKGSPISGTREQGVLALEHTVYVESPPMLTPVKAEDHTQL